MDPEEQEHSGAESTRRDTIGLSITSTQTPVPTIVSAYEACIRKATQLGHLLGDTRCSAGHKTLATSFQNEIGRFRVWAGNMGAHRRGRVSLDHKLREALSTQALVRKFLEQLGETIQKASIALLEELVDDGENSTDSGISDEDEEPLDDELREYLKQNPFEDTDTELEDAFVDIAQIVGCLYSLSVTLRNPVPTERLKRSQRINMDHYESFDVQHAADKFPGIPDYLVTRLGKANTKRRQMFEYLRQHHDKIARYVDVVPEEETELSVVKKAKNTSTQDMEIITPVGPQIEVQSTSRKSQTTVSIFIERDKNANVDTQSEGAVSQTSYAFSNADATTHIIHIPPPPNSEQACDGEPFECPFCFSIITVKGQADWKSHVFDDLRPYVCTFENCTLENHLFEKRHEWFRHELEVHRREWYCKICCRISATKGEFQNHLEVSHSDIVNTENLDIVMRSCEKALDQHSCVFCSGTYTTDRLRSHLAHHLQQLALFVLPRSEREDQSEADSNNSWGQTGSIAGELRTGSISFPGSHLESEEDKFDEPQAGPVIAEYETSDDFVDPGDGTDNGEDDAAAAAGVKELKCPWLGCNRRSPEDYGDMKMLKEHIRRAHIKPYVCALDGCDFRRGDHNQIMWHYRVKHTPRHELAGPFDDSDHWTRVEETTDALDLWKHQALKIRGLDISQITAICRATTVPNLPPATQTRASSASKSSSINSLEALGQSEGERAEFDEDEKTELHGFQGVTKGPKESSAKKLEDKETPHVKDPYVGNPFKFLDKDVKDPNVGDLLQFLDKDVVAPSAAVLEALQACDYEAALQIPLKTIALCNRMGLSEEHWIRDHKLILSIGKYLKSRHGDDVSWYFRAVESYNEVSSKALHGPRLEICLVVSQAVFTAGKVEHPPMHLDIILEQTRELIGTITPNTLPLVENIVQVLRLQPQFAPAHTWLDWLGQYSADPLSPSIINSQRHSSPSPPAPSPSPPAPYPPQPDPRAYDSEYNPPSPPLGPPPDLDDQPPIWTKISRSILSKRAVVIRGYDFEKTADAINIHRELDESEINELVDLSEKIRTGNFEAVQGLSRRSSDSSLSSTSTALGIAGENDDTSTVAHTSSEFDNSTPPYGGPHELWTKISRRLVSKRAVSVRGYEFEKTADAITVYRVLGKSDIDDLVDLTGKIRTGNFEAVQGLSRRSSDSSLSSTSTALGIAGEDDDTVTHSEVVHIPPPGVVHELFWTKISRQLVSKRAVVTRGYEFENTADKIIVYRVLGESDIDDLVDLTEQIRSGKLKVRERRSSQKRNRSSNDPEVDLEAGIGADSDWSDSPYNSPTTSSSAPSETHSVRSMRAEGPNSEKNDDGSPEIPCICICGYHDTNGGLTLQCENCKTLQHLICMQTSDSTAVSSEYLCVRCAPRFVDVQRAIDLQKRSRREVTFSGRVQVRTFFDESDT